ncbi:MAG: transglycosylase family protein, partial [Actinomycetota bacterium]|nr:transglycosylase family protein [Actinomycetota bacterium]
RVLVERSVLRRPVSRLVEYGTKARVYAAPGTPVGDLNWYALAQCESGGNPRAVNPAGYYGLYQFSLGTWAGVGGSGNPIDASPAEQLYRAQLLYASRGAQPWPVCGPLLFT